LMEKYAKPGFPWRWLLAALALVLAVAAFIVWRRERTPEAARPSTFALPSELNALTVLGLLRRIRAGAPLGSAQIVELDQTIAQLEAHHYGARNLPGPDLDQTARHWVSVAG